MSFCELQQLKQHSKLVQLEGDTKNKEDDRQTEFTHILRDLTY